MQAVVIDTTRTTNEGVQITETRVDTGGGNVVTADHFEAAGDDSLPLPGDYAALADGTGKGAVEALGYHDGKNAGKAAPGERRIYSRKLDGTVVLELWFKGDGRLEINGLVNGGSIVLDPSDGSVTLNGTKFDKQGNVTAPGEITAKAGTPVSVTLSQHTHGSGTGPTTPPTPGT